MIRKSINHRLLKRIFKLENELKKLNNKISTLYSEIEYQESRTTKGFIYMQDEIFKSTQYLKDEIDNLGQK